MVGGPDSPSTPTSPATRPADSRSAVRHASRPMTSGGSHSPLSTVDPPKALTPKYSSRHSSTGTLFSSDRFRRKARAARAFASASGHEYTSLASPEYPADVHTRPL